MTLIASSISSHLDKPLLRSIDINDDGFCRVGGQEMYRIASYDRLAPFLMSIVSDTDLWMFVSSTGGLTAGRVSEDRALFPYETDDKLHKCGGITGPFTLIRVKHSTRPMTLWEPFAQSFSASPVRRNLYKSVLGNSLLFEEIRPDLGLRFSYRWSTTDRYGFVRTCTLENDNSYPVEVELLDGLLNILPAGAELGTQQKASCLINAYTQCEVDRGTGMGLFSMTSRIIDKAEPAEALRANVVWSSGLADPCVLLSMDQAMAFAQGGPVQPESILKGRRGAYLVVSRLTLAAGERRRWDIVTDSYLDQIRIESLRTQIALPSIESAIDAAIAQGNDNLVRNVASADGIQAGGDRMATAHHFANVLFNNMRGGVFADNHHVPVQDLIHFIQTRNRSVISAAAEFFSALPASLPIDVIINIVKGQANPDLTRLCYEYLPVTFSRRHGDPSRPWNRFAIRVKDADGGPLLSYQGNWRDIFQNWEAMCISFPSFIDNVIAKFVNASTADGFNPYRVTREGIEWETPDPHDPWAHIGYWGDHQIVYLLRLLEQSHKLHNGRLAAMLDEAVFAYANVPYRLKPYTDIVKDPRNTIDFDQTLHREIAQRVRQIGSDGKLLTAADGTVLHVNLMEKLLVPMLSKLSNLVVGGGIWMNTQRPEWNDGNNALVGNGISVVTLCYLRRYVAFTMDLIAEAESPTFAISTEVALWLQDISTILDRHSSIFQQSEISDRDRRSVLDELGTAFDRYRQQVYTAGLSAMRDVSVETIKDLLTQSLIFIDHGIAANRRTDGMYHAYNLLHLSDGSARVDHLYEMLEGQVAVLSSGMLSAHQAVDLIDAMFDSELYRPDQNTFMLYPRRELPAFMDRNVVPSDDVRQNPLLSALLEAGDRTLLAADPSGQFRFDADLRNAIVLSAALDRLGDDPRWMSLVNDHRQAVLDLYEAVFDHRRFTGRSSAMYGYEGIGCIYWHMVSKLLLAVQECHFKAIADGESTALVAELAKQYYRVRSGLGFNKSPKEYGAFPLDPYSHTPDHAGAQQPGMTGQVKEEILTRWGELGVRINNGVISFAPSLLRESEFSSNSHDWSYVDLNGQQQSVQLPVGAVAFTICQTPVIYHLAVVPVNNVVVKTDGQTASFSGLQLDEQTSAHVLGRTGTITRIEIHLVDRRPTINLSPNDQSTSASIL